MPELPKFAIVGSATLGIATVILGLIMLFVFPSSAELSAGFRTPIIAFEFASNEEDLAFLSGDSEVNRLNRKMMDAGHRWDTVFPFAYAGFIALLLLQGVTRGKYWLALAIPIALLIIPLDLRENSILLAITKALGNSASTEVLLQELHVATWLKWGALGLCMAVLSIGHFAEKAYPSAAISAIAALSVLSCRGSGSEPALTEVMSAAVFLFFAYFAIRSCIQAWHCLRQQGS